MRKQPLWTASALVALVACSDSPLTGNTVETENSIAARSFLVDSLLEDVDDLAQPTAIATLRVDRGNFPFFDSTTLGGRNLSVETSVGTPVSFHVGFWDKAAGLGRLHVRFDSSLRMGIKRITLHAKSRDVNRSDSTAVWKGFNADQWLALNSTLVDDFEHPLLRSLLPDSGTWYSDKSKGDSVSSPSRSTPGSNGKNGTALKVTYAAPSNVVGRYALVGVNLTKRPHSLRTLDSIVFFARGSGKLAVALDRSSTQPGKAWTRQGLSSDWTRHVVRVSELEPADPVADNVGWEAVRDSITNINFIVTGGSELWLDNIRMYGVNRSDLR